MKNASRITIFILGAFLLFAVFSSRLVFASKYEILEKPKASYTLNEVILYRIKLKTPSSDQSLRMLEPKTELKNLTLAGISQESVSGPNQTDNATLSDKERLITFRFLAEKPGNAEIRFIRIDWAQNDGAVVDSAELPSFRLAITKPVSQSWFIFPLIITILIAAVFTIAFFILKRKKNEPVKPKPLTMEETHLNNLRELEKQIAIVPQNEFLGNLDRLFKNYLSQKLSWQPNEGSYNGLIKIVESKWTKKESWELKELLESLEFHRFSGSHLAKNELMGLYHSVYKFIERKKMIENNLEG